jgi:sec-independent protein translocase protein TatB
VFDIGLGEVLLVIVVAVIVLGPERLPEAAREMGRFIRAVRTTLHDLRQSATFLDDPATTRAPQLPPVMTPPPPESKPHDDPAK